ncbi:condensin [Coprinopsis sp. MPI-PUGE-AT-0042]|nr:condensin [Coprinopsis sp. MPI-PUGE-AT-0042]
MGYIEEFHLQESAAKLEDADKASQYEIPDEDEVADGNLADLLDAAVERVADNSDEIRDSQVFAVYCLCMRKSETTPGATMGKLLDSISSGLKAETDAVIRDVEAGDQDGYMSHKLPLELYATAADKVKSAPEDAPAPKGKRGRGGKAATSRTATRRVENWSWESQIPDVLSAILRLLVKVQTQRIWTTSGERDAFVNCLLKPAYNVLSNEQYMKSGEIKKGIFNVLCHGVKSHNQSTPLQAYFQGALDFYEHLPETLAECLYFLASKFDHGQTGDEVLRKIAGQTFDQSVDAKGPRTYARFLVHYTTLCPRSTLKQLALLINQQDSDAYPIRQAIIEILGLLIDHLQSGIEDQAGSESAGQDNQKTQKEIAGMFEHIFERLLDNSSYVRTKVFAVLNKICDLKTKFPRYRIKMATYAAEALKDKTATVRKAAISLLVKLIETHCWSEADGGLLSKPKFKELYDDATKELSEMEGKLGKVVERADDDEEAQEVPSQRKKSKKAKKRQRGDDEMEVDDEDENEDEDEDEDDEEGGDTEPEDETMSVDGDGAGSQRPPLRPRQSIIDVNALAEEQAAVASLQEQEYLQKKLARKYFREGMYFIELVEAAMDTIEKLLGSKSKPEVLEAIDFFRIAHVYQFAQAQSGIKKMLHLIWTKDNNATIAEDGKEVKGIRQKLLECYKQLYFDPVVDLEPRKQVSRIAKNLIERTYEATLAELTSLEEMLRIMMEEDYIHHDIISKLWQIYTSHQHIPHEQRRGAIIVLGMMGIARPQEVLADRVEVMLKVGLGKLGKADLTLARYTCVALQRLNGSAKKVKGSLEDKTVRYPMDNPIFKKLMSITTHACRSKDWFGLAEQVINTVYALGEHPDVFCNDLIKRLTIRAFSRGAAGGSTASGDGGEGTPPEKDPEAMDEDGQPPAQPPAQTQDGEDEAMNPEGDAPPTISQAPRASSTAPADKDLGDAFELSQLLFVVGHVAIKHIVYLELVEREWKRQKDAKAAAEKKAAGADTGRNAKDKDGDELDQVAGNAEDEIGDQIAAIREKELLYGSQSLLAIYGPMIVHICGSPHKFKNPTLRAAATLAFSKFLCVSSQFCDAHHRLLFKILETSRDANIRSNIVIALGDVAVAFNHIIDENSADLYKGLSDKNMTVKKNTLMVLTHLILNGMIKVKGQLGEMAKCVDDSDERIADLARLFFSELSTKENAIYNNLPDVISHLSSGDHAVDEDKFESTMRYIFTFIEKDKQAEAIVQKLCERFHLTSDARQWRDIAFCLSLLPFKSEKSVKKLIEGLPFYRDKLHEPKVYARFLEILIKARQNKSKEKPDAELDEFEKILEEHKQEGEADQELQKLVKKTQKKKATRGRKKAAAPAPMDED